MILKWLAGEKCKSPCRVLTIRFFGASKLRVAGHDDDDDDGSK